MARDYKTAAQAGAHSPDGSASRCGLAAGLAVAASCTSRIIGPMRRRRNAAKADKKRPHNTDEPPDADGRRAGGRTSSGNSYDFYDELPKFEVVVPEKDKDVRPDIAPCPRRAAAPMCCRPGSYKNFADADRVRASSRCRASSPRCRRCPVDNDTWHRIRIGPISKLDELNRLRRSCARPTSTCW
jgi:hypothetical protein